MKNIRAHTRPQLHSHWHFMETWMDEHHTMSDFGRIIATSMRACTPMIELLKKQLPADSGSASGCAS